MPQVSIFAATRSDTHIAYEVARNASLGALLRSIDGMRRALGDNEIPPSNVSKVNAVMRGWKLAAIERLERQGYTPQEALEIVNDKKASVVS